MIAKSCIIIEDELGAVDRLKFYITQVPALNLLKIYTDPLFAMHDLQSTAPVDLIFMDIDMPELNGIDLAEIVRDRTNKLIFTTGHLKHAYDAFRVDGNAYLLKPFSLAEFITTVNKVLFNNHTTSKLPDKQGLFFVKSKADNLKLLSVKYNDIAAIESKLNYVLIYTKDRNITTHMSLKDVSKSLLHRGNFFQFNRSFILNEQYIDSVDGSTIYMENGLKIRVGDTFRADFARYISNTLLNASKKTF